MAEQATPAESKPIEDNLIGSRSVVPVPFDLTFEKVPDLRMSNFTCTARVRSFLASSDESRQFDKELSKTDLAFAQDNLVQMYLSTGTSSAYPLMAISIKHDADHKEMLQHLLPIIQKGIIEGFKDAIRKVNEKLPFNSNETYTKRVYVLDFALSMNQLQILNRNIREAELARDGGLETFPRSDIAPTIARLKKLADRAEKKIETFAFQDVGEREKLENQIKRLRGQAKRGEKLLENYVDEAIKEKRNAINNAINTFQRVKERGFQNEHEPEKAESIQDPEKRMDKLIWDQIVADVSEAVREGFVGTHGKELSIDRFKTEYGEFFTKES